MEKEGLVLVDGLNFIHAKEAPLAIAAYLILFGIVMILTALVNEEMDTPEEAMTKLKEKERKLKEKEEKLKRIEEQLKSVR